MRAIASDSEWLSAGIYAIIRTSFFGARVTAYSGVSCTIYLAWARRSHDCAYCCAVARTPLAAARTVAIAAPSHVAIFLFFWFFSALKHDFQYLKLQNFLREGEPPSRTHPQEVRSLRSLTCSNFPLFLIFLCLMPVKPKYSLGKWWKWKISLMGIVHKSCTSSQSPVNLFVRNHQFS